MTVTATEFKQSGGNSRELVREMKASKINTICIDKTQRNFLFILSEHVILYV